MRLFTSAISLIFFLWPGFNWAHEVTNTQHEGTTPHIHTTSTARPCEAEPGKSSSCTPILACIGGEGEFFQGQARGWGQLGILRGKTGSGAHCSGFWQRGNALGVGQAKINCSNGTRAEVFWNARHRETGFFVGSGEDSENRSVLAWTGHEVLSRIAKEGVALDVFCASHAQGFNARLDTIGG